MYKINKELITWRIQLNSESHVSNNPKRQSGAFVAFYFAQNRFFYVATVPFLSLLHVGRVGTLPSL